MLETSASVGSVHIKVNKWENDNKEAPPIILVHGGPGLFGYFKGLAEDLHHNGHTVWDYYQRGPKMQGYGVSVTVDNHISDLHDLVLQMQKEFGKKPQVIAHSWGGILSLMCESRHSCFSKVVLVNAMPFDFEGVGEFASNIEARLNSEENELRKLQLMQLSKLEPGDAKDALFAEMGDNVYKTYQKSNLDVPFSHLLDGLDATSFFETHASLAAMMGTQLIPDSIKRVSVPVQHIFGSYDPCPGKRVSKVLNELLVDFDATEIDDCGHYPWLEESQTWQKARTVLLSALSH